MKISDSKNKRLLISEFNGYHKNYISDAVHFRLTLKELYGGNPKIAFCKKGTYIFRKNNYAYNAFGIRSYNGSISTIINNGEGIVGLAQEYKRRGISNINT